MKTWISAVCFLLVTSCGSVERSDAPASQEAQSDNSDKFAVRAIKANLRAEPSGDSTILAELPLGTLVKPLASELVDANPHEFYEELWLHVEVGNLTGWIYYVSLLPAPIFEYYARAGITYHFSVGDDSTKKENYPIQWEKYVVYANPVNLRAEPSSEAKVVTTLTAGTTVETHGYWGYVEDKSQSGVYWFPARYGTYCGWLTYECIILSDLFEKYGEAHRLGTTGDAKGMVKSLQAITAPYQGSLNISPDSHKIVIMGIPPHDEPMFPIVPLYFESGKGLAKAGSPLSVVGLWSPDSRYFAFVHDRDYMGSMGRFYLFDTSQSEYISLGTTLNSYYKRHDAMEYLDGHIIWVNFKYTSGYAIPELVAYELASGIVTILLKGDLNTVRSVGDNNHEMRLIPPVPKPDVFKNSRLYRKYNGRYIMCDVEGA